MPANSVRTSVNISDEDAERLEAFKRELEDDADALDDQRDKANEDMRFVNVDGGTWEGFYEEVFDFPDRVRLEMDIISNPLQRFIGEWNQNRAGVEFKPTDKGTTKDDAKLLNGIYRSDFRDYSGGVATDNAVMECATVGLGAFRLANEFDDDGDPENENQHIEWRPIYNAYNTVYWDQSALRIDKKDAGHCTILKQYTKPSFEKEFPGADPTSAYVPESRDFIGRTLANTSQVDLVFVATRYEIVKKKTKVYVYNNLNTEKIETYPEADHEKIKDELRKDEARVFVRERMVIHQTCEKTVFSGTEILEPTRRIAGKYIPVVSFYGYRAFVDGTERYRGIVRKMKDAQRLFNVQVSQLAENSASNGQEVPVFLSEQMQNPNIANDWADKNNKAFLVVDPAVDDDGNVIATGPVGYNKPGQLDASTTALLTIVPQYIKDVSGFEVGEAIDKEASGKALAQMIKRENMNTQVINDNIANAIAYSGEIYQAMAQEIYTTPRMVRTLSRDGTDGTADLMQPVMDEETGQFIESNDLRNKRFMAYADVGPQYETIREETVENMKGLLELAANDPDMAEYKPIILSVMMDNITGVGLDPLKEFNREKMLLLGIAKPENEQEEAFLAEAAEAQGQPDQQQQLLEAATEQSLAEARNLDAASAEKVANADLKRAQTAKTISEIETSQEKVRQDGQRLLQDARKEAREQLVQLPIGQGRPQ